MPNKIIAVRLHGGGKLEDYDANGIDIPHGDYIVIEGTHGAELGRAASVPRDRTPAEEALVLRPVIRLATAADLDQDAKWQARAPEAVAKCKELSVRLNLAMKPMMGFYSLDGGHLTLYFTSDTRVDFRDLVRDLRHALNSRVELRQVGPRDEARLFGAVGRCGRSLCCQTFIQEFAPVSIRMAKDQELSLNPMKVSGVCGRLLCCLGYEAEYYRTVKDKAPRPGQDVSFPAGRGRVLNISALRESVIVMLPNETTTEVPIAQVTWERRLRSGEKTVEEQQTAAGITPGTPAPSAGAAPVTAAPAPAATSAPTGVPVPPAATPPPPSGQPWARGGRRNDRPRQDRQPGGPPRPGNVQGVPPAPGNTPNQGNLPNQGAPGNPPRQNPPGSPARRFDRPRQDRRPSGAPRPGVPPVAPPPAGPPPASQAPTPPPTPPPPPAAPPTSPA